MRVAEWKTLPTCYHNVYFFANPPPHVFFISQIPPSNVKKIKCVGAFTVKIKCMGGVRKLFQSTPPEDFKWNNPYDWVPMARIVLG